jgi:hypothetical protein
MIANSFDDSNESDDKPPFLFGMGRREEASYRPSDIVAYHGNPYIEALPDILSEDEALEALAYYPSYDESERLLPPHKRLHLIQLALDAFIPLPVHLDLEQRFSRLIRVGYQGRNPLVRGFWQEQDEKVRSIHVPQNSPRVRRRCLATCSAGACVATLMLSGREEEVGQYWRERCRDVTKNFEWGRLLNGKRPTPHEPLYRDMLL